MGHVKACKCAEGIENSGEGGGGGVVSEITFPDGQVRCCDDPVRKSLLTYFADILHRKK